MIGGFVAEGALIGAAGCAVWEVAVLVRRWVRDRRRLRKLAAYLDKTRDKLRDVALNVWKANDPSLRSLAHTMLDVAAELETAATRCQSHRWRPRREHTQQLSNLLAASQVLRRASHDPHLTGTADAATLGILADSFRRTVALETVVEPRFTAPIVPSPSLPTTTPAAPVDLDIARAITTGLATPNRSIHKSPPAKPYVGKHREKNTRQL
ncbi:hypothetical protein [Kribbella jiaozuonensis]|uniref:Uncharacterized protein n=1 Tax=Kribbella jiaozuonensis TaxID=2575441 RepID=A0A4U3LJ81_9ACTN|nr:hypothetical protein [Kribbella jiaozuonensis]TKK75610.1 hypothetical protein FDA38_35065 [Kribbella jiaozuonensis]